MRFESGLRFSLWISIGTWVGAWGFFAFVVSRVAFQMLPGNIAGDLAGDLLTKLHYGGAAAGLVAAGAAWALGRRGWVIGLPIALAVLCLGSEWILSPAVATTRPTTLGAASTTESQERFRLLHRLSLGLFMAIHLASLVLAGLHARLDGVAAAPHPEE